MTKDGTVIMDTEGIATRWNEYITELFDDDRSYKPQIKKDIKEPPILQAEIELTLRRTKTGKSAGPDERAVQMLKTLGIFE